MLPARSVHWRAASGEGWGHLNAAADGDAVRTEGATGQGARRLLGQRGRRQAIADLGPEAAERETWPGGRRGGLRLREPGTGLLRDEPAGRLSLEYMVADYPGLMEALVGMRASASSCPLGGARQAGASWATGGVPRRWTTGRVDGEDPLAPFSPHTAQFLRGCPATPTWATSSEQPGGSRERAGRRLRGVDRLPRRRGRAADAAACALPRPTWSATDPQIVGAEAVHAFLSQYVWAESSSTPRSLNG